MRRHFLLAILLAVFCAGCSGITVGLPGQPSVAPPEVVVPDSPCCPDGACPSREVLFFTMPGCSPCEQAKPQVEELRKQGMKVTEVDVYKHPDLTRQYQITQTPTFIILENGVEIERTSSISALIIILVKMLAWILPFLLA